MYNTHINSTMLFLGEQNGTKTNEMPKTLTQCTQTQQTWVYKSSWRPSPCRQSRNIFMYDNRGLHPAGRSHSLRHVFGLAGSVGVNRREGRGEGCAVCLPLVPVIRVLVVIKGSPVGRQHRTAAKAKAICGLGCAAITAREEHPEQISIQPSHTNTHSLLAWLPASLSSWVLTARQRPLNV